MRKRLLVVVGLMTLLLSGCAMATNGQWTYVRIGTTNQGLEVHDGDKSVKVDSQSIDLNALKAALQVIGNLK